LVEKENKPKSISKTFLSQFKSKLAEQVAFTATAFFHVFSPENYIRIVYRPSLRHKQQIYKRRDPWYMLLKPGDYINSAVKMQITRGMVIGACEWLQEMERGVSYQG
jgi:hypothetical protein